jgi:cytochrome oxidase Cu insertion factor (SCO1/SenC/PrrC family)
MLWALVVVAAVILIYVSNRPPTTPPSDVPEGMVLVDVPWKHLPDVDRFKLTDQNGEEFDTADLVGKPYVVSFFFASCPTFCLELNKELERVNRALKDTDIQFLTITVDPEHDSPEVLKKYAEGFGATPDRWAFLTGQKYQIQEIGEQMFNVIVDRDTHTDNILLVDKWGRYRDRFKWDQPYDMKRFVKVAKEVAAEKDPPLEKTIKTRNVLAGFEQPDLGNVPWIRDFHLTERSGKKFFSRELVGQVWIANFFFSTCPGICKRQNEYLRDLQNRLGDQCPVIVSISTDPTNDTPERLREFADKLGAMQDRWLFCTGNPLLIKRIGAEFFRAPSDGAHHSSLLFVVDRWGDVRGSFDWEDSKQEIKMLELIKQLESETRPQRPVDLEKTNPPVLDDDLGGGA